MTSRRTRRAQMNRSPRPHAKNATTYARACAQSLAASRMMRNWTSGCASTRKDTKKVMNDECGMMNDERETCCVNSSFRIHHLLWRYAFDHDLVVHGLDAADGAGEAFGARLEVGRLD